MTTCVHRPHGKGVGVCASCLRDRLLALAVARLEQHTSVTAASWQAHPLQEPRPFRRASSSSDACRSPREPLHRAVCGRCGSDKFPVRSSLFAPQRSEKAEPEQTGTPKSSKSTDVQARRRKRSSRKLTKGRKQGPESERNTESTGKSSRRGREASSNQRHRLWLGLAGVSMCIRQFMRTPCRRQKGSSGEPEEDGQPAPPTAGGPAEDLTVT